MMRPLIASLIMSAAWLSAADEPNIFIRELQGPASLRSIDGKPIPLNRREHLGRKLHVGEAVQCRPGCKLVIQSEGVEQVIPPSSTSTWVTVLWRPTAVQSAQQARNAAAAKNYGRPGASEKAVRSVVYSPAGASVARPSTFRIAWTKAEAAARINLSIADEDGDELWRQNGVAGAVGMLESQAVRDALRNHRDSGATGSLTLTFDQGGRRTEAFFSLLSPAAERELDLQLKEWELPATDLMGYLGRAEIFARHRMLNDEARELEAALEQSPASVDLMVRTILAERRIGNVERSRELARKLPAGTAIPE